MNMFSKILAVAGVVLLSAVSCKNEDSCKVSFPVAGAFVNDWGESTTVKFNAVNVSSISVTSVTGGWTAEVDLPSRTLTVTAPESENAEDAARTANVTLSAKSPKGASAGAVLVAYIVDATVDLSADGSQSNCYVVSQPNMKYRFNAKVKGETSEPLATSKIGIVWQSDDELIKYLNLDEDGYANFYMGYAEDEDGNDTTDIIDGNALLAAYDEAGNILWSWHIWSASKDPRTDGVATYSNGVTFMDRNLGAYANPNGSTETDEIWDGYGLYYQWGRKDPFLRPEYYDCARNADETVYDADGSYVYVSYTASNAETGTIEYTIKNPTTFITTTSENNGDWLYGTRNDDLWGAGGEKSLYDPCPKGWRVPAKNDFAVLDIAEAEDNMNLEEAKKLYGWQLTDMASGQKHFYPGSGYRSYFDGILSNMNYKDEYPYTPMPWVGYYWTNAAGSATATKANAMFFDLNTSRAVINAFNATSDQYRANAMQVRCVKEQ